MTDIERHSFDVVVIGAGGAGLRAAIEARAQGLRTAIVCKSLLGKAHTVMAEGGIAAAMGNVNSDDRLAGALPRHHARRQVPQQLADGASCTRRRRRTGSGSSRRGARCSTARKDGRISQRNFGGHEYPRLAHVGDRTGLEMIRTLQQRIVALQQEDFRDYGDYEARLKVFTECTVTELLLDGDRVAGALRLLARDRPVRPVRGPGRRPRHRRHRQVATRSPVNSWEYTGDGHALALRAGAEPDQHGVRPVPSDRDGLAAERARASWSPSGARRRRRPAQLRGQAVHVRLHPRRLPGAVRARPRRRRDRWYTDQDKQPPPARSCCPATRWPGPSTPRSRPGAGHPHGGVFLDIAVAAARRRTSASKLPSMYHQFKELADVDITAGADGGRADLPLHDGRHRGGPRHGSRRARARPVRRRRGRRRHARRRTGSAATRCRTCSCSAGGPARRRRVRQAPGDVRPSVSRGRRRAAAAQRALAPFERDGGENPYTLHAGPAADDARPGRHHPAASSEMTDALDRARRAASSGPGRSASRGTGSSTRAGTWRSTCATC